jgi:hypothetical protein
LLSSLPKPYSTVVNYFIWLLIQKEELTSLPFLSVRQLLSSLSKPYSTVVNYFIWLLIQKEELTSIAEPHKGFFSVSLVTDITQPDRALPSSLIATPQLVND